VGYHNQKFFINFMFHGVVGLGYVLLWVVIRAVGIFSEAPAAPGMPLPRAPPATIIAIAVNGILSIALMFSIAMLMSYQIWCVSKNTTTIEHYDYSRRKRWAKRNRMLFMYPFDNGAMNNFRATMGETWRDWISTKKTNGDGLHEHISGEFIHSLEKGFTHWNVVDDQVRKGFLLVWTVFSSFFFFFFFFSLLGGA
jgi:hypothetical protein